MYVVTAVHEKGGSHVAIKQDSFCHCKVKTKLNLKSLIQIFQIIFLVFCLKLLKMYSPNVFFKDGLMLYVLESLKLNTNFNCKIQIKNA